jgi:ribonuclease T1
VVKVNKTEAGLVKKLSNIFKHLALVLVAVMATAPVSAQRENDSQREAKPPRIQIALADISVKALPPEARETLQLIEKGGPYPYDRDGIVFGNFEKRLPIKERGYYNEFTVKTPGVKHRGARRIVAGKGGEKFYSDDHYKTFKRIVP